MRPVHGIPRLDQRWRGVEAWLRATVRLEMSCCSFEVWRARDSSPRSPLRRQLRHESGPRAPVLVWRLRSPRRAHLGPVLGICERRGRACRLEERRSRSCEELVECRCRESCAEARVGAIGGAWLRRREEVGARPASAELLSPRLLVSLAANTGGLAKESTRLSFLLYLVLEEVRVRRGFEGQTSLMRCERRGCSSSSA